MQPLTNHHQKTRPGLIRLLIICSCLFASACEAEQKTETGVQAHNIAWIKTINGDHRFIPHKINTPDRLETVKALQLPGMEIDVVFEPSKKQFLVGKPADNPEPLPLQKHLSNISSESAKKIWLDIKGLKVNEIPEAMDALQKITANQGIPKQVFIVESSLQSPDLRLFSEAGFHTSYYIPTKDSLQRLNPEQKRIMLAENIINLVKQQHPDALSFDYRLYDFIKSLENDLPIDMVYHIWGPFHANRPGFKNRLTQQNFFQDKKVKTVLFNLHP